MTMMLMTMRMTVVMIMIGEDIGTSQGWAGVNLVSRRKILLLISRRDVALCPIFPSNGDDGCTERKQMNKDKRRFITLGKEYLRFFCLMLTTRLTSVPLELILIFNYITQI